MYGLAVKQCKILNRPNLFDHLRAKEMPKVDVKSEPRDMILHHKLLFRPQNLMQKQNQIELHMHRTHLAY